MGGTINPFFALSRPLTAAAYQFTNNKGTASYAAPSSKGSDKFSVTLNDNEVAFLTFKSPW